MRRAQNYELGNLQRFACEAAVEVFLTKSQEVKQLFNEQVKYFEHEYSKMEDIHRKYEQELRVAYRKISMQEVMIAELTGHISVNMRQRFLTRLEEKDIEMTKKDEIEKFKDPFKLLYSTKQFDFFGRHLRIHESETEKFLQSMMVKEAHKNMDRLRSELNQTKIELHTTFQLWKEQQMQFHNERDTLLVRVDDLQRENKSLKIKMEANEDSY